MNPDIKAQWVQALRSGEYLQGQGRLCTITDYGKRWCCLGVLMDLAEKAGIVQSAGVQMPTSYAPTRMAWLNGNGGHDTHVLSWAVANWAGLTEYNPTVRTEEGDVVVLSSLNDDMNYSLSRIADFIEEQL